MRTLNNGIYSIFFYSRQGITQENSAKNQLKKIPERREAVQNITESEYLEQCLKASEQRLQIILDTIPECLKIIDADGTLLEINSAGLALMEADKKSQVLGQSFYSIIVPEHRELFVGLVQQVYRGESGILQFEIIGLKGTHRWMETHAVPLPDEKNQIIAILTITRDITQQKQAEEQLQEAYQFTNLAQTTLQRTKDELECKVKERTQQLSHANIQLKCELLKHQHTQRQLQKQAQLLELAHDAIIVVDLNDIITFWNHGAEVMYGCSKAEALGKELVTLLETQFPQPLPQIEADLFLHGEWAGELTHMKHDGTTIIVSSRWVVQRDLDGKPIEILKINRDITEHKQTEQALIESETLYRQMFEVNKAVKLLINPKSGEIIDANLAASRFYGYELEKLKRLKITDLNTLPRHRVFAQMSQTSAKHREFEFRHRLASGEIRDVSVYSSPITLLGQPLLYSIIHDITERKQAQQALQEREAILHSFFDSAPMMMGIVEVLEDDILHLSDNASTAKFFGLTPEAMKNRKASEIGVPQEYIHHWIRHYRESEALGRPIRFEYFDQSATPSRWLSATVTAIAKTPENSSQFCYIVEDITQRKYAQEQLRKERNLLNGIMQTSVAAITVVDCQGCIVFANDYATQVLGLSKSEITQRSYNAMEWKITDFEGTPLPDEQLPFRRVITTGKPVFDVQHAIEWPDGKRRYLSINGSPLFAPSGEIKDIVFSVADITEHKQAEEALKRSEAHLREKTIQLKETLQELQITQTQLIQAEKMSSLGQIVAGIAHEINNPANFIYGNISCTQEYVQDIVDLLQLYQQQYTQENPEIQAKMEDIDLEFLTGDLFKILGSMKKGTERIREIVMSLRNFSRLDEAEKKRVDLHEGIDNTLLILNHRIVKDPRIKIIKEYGKLPSVLCCAAQVNQVFMNVINNAIDALKEKNNSRIITIRTELLDANKSVDFGIVSSVRVRIQDNGSGIPSEIINNIFDPFFTTKPVGQGTGLGLAISYQILQKHGGQIQVNSRMGEGTEFVITLPLI